MLVTPLETKALRAIEQLIRKDIEWSGVAIEQHEMVEVPTGRRGRGRHPARLPGADRRPAEKREPRQTKQAQAPRAKKQPSPSAVRDVPERAAVKPSQPVRPHLRPKPQAGRDGPEGHGFNDHLPAFLARPVR